MFNNRFRPLWVVVCLWPMLAGGQEQALDLKSALSAAEAGNLELRAARQQRALAVAGITTAKQLPNPSISFSASRDAPHESVLWDQPIELGGKRAKRIAVAREEQKSVEIDVLVLGRQIRRRTRESFYRALAARAQTAQSKAALDLATRIRDVVRQRYDVGDVAQLEVIQAEVELARAAADYDAVEQAQRSAFVTLAALLNRPLEGMLPISGKLETMPPPVPLGELTAQALNSNADLLKITQDLRTEERRLALARSQKVPNLALQVGTDLNSPPDFNVGPRGQIGITLPLLYHGQGEIALSSARVELLRLSLEAQRTNAAAQVAAAYFDYVSKMRQAQQYGEQIVPQTERLERMAEDSYRSGKSNLLTLIDTQRKLNDVRKAYLDILFAAQSSFAALEESVGVPLD